MFIFYLNFKHFLAKKKIALSSPFKVPKQIISDDPVNNPEQRENEYGQLLTEKIFIPAFAHVYICFKTIAELIDVQYYDIA